MPPKPSPPTGYSRWSQHAQKACLARPAQSSDGRWRWPMALWRRPVSPRRRWCGQECFADDPSFVEELHDVVGLYVSSPGHAVVLSLDEKSQIPAMHRTQPGLPIEDALRCDADPRRQAQRHDDPVRRTHRAGGKRVRTKCAAPPASGVHPLPQCPGARHPSRKGRPRDHGQRSRPQDPRGEAVAGPQSTLGVPLHPDLQFQAECRQRLLRQAPRRRLKHGVFRSLVELQATINRFIAEHNQASKPFICRANPDKIIAAEPEGSKRWSHH